GRRSLGRAAGDARQARRHLRRAGLQRAAADARPARPGFAHLRRARDPDDHPLDPAAAHEHDDGAVAGRPRRTPMKKTARNDGFTVLEIMVVVLIIGMLMALIAPRIFGRFTQTKADLAKVGVKQIAQQLELYKLDNGQYPTSEQGLDALVHEPTSEPRAKRY